MGTSQNDRDISPVFDDTGIAPGSFDLSGIGRDTDKLRLVFPNNTFQ